MNRFRGRVKRDGSKKGTIRGRCSGTKRHEVAFCGKIASWRRELPVIQA
ncbi:hypothetical protein M1105_02460 [Limibaculum sp. FT325]|nr:hypothetical protein [Limibaculum sediminis]MCL5775862.1 hypothetical protein [Limibaculum sediminis]